MHGVPHLRSAQCAAALLVVLVIAAAGPSLAGPSRHEAVLAAHAPISIVGDAGFNATNGVTGGSGTAADPYVIAGWSIDAPPSIGVQIRGTTAHAILRDLSVTNAPVAGFYAYNVANLSLSNFTASAATGDGIRVESSRDVWIQGSSITENNDGIVVLTSTRVSLLGNNVTFNGGDGLTVSQCDGVLVRANVFYHDAFSHGYGLTLTSSTNVTVRTNAFTGNSIFLDGGTADAFDSHTFGGDNLVSGLPILYVANRAGVTLSNIQLGELILANCTHAHVANLTTTGGDIGIEVAYSTDVLLGPNVAVSNAGLGLRIVSSNLARFVDGSIINATAGARIESSSGVTIEGSRISAPFTLGVPDDAVAIQGSDRVNVSDNILRHHLNGVSVSSSGNVTLLGNVASSDAQGIGMEGSQNLLLLDNVLSQDTVGLGAADVVNASVVQNLVVGTTLGVNLSFSSRLRFVHNAFLGDSVNAYDGNASLNSWDGGYPTGGNFWWTYHGVDDCRGALQNICTGPDGIGDTPYTFNLSAEDRYPLMRAAIPTDVPPEALFLISSRVGTVLTSFRVTANLSSDYEDVLAALLVRWDWEGNGTWTGWTATKFAAHTYSVPGVHTIVLEVADRAGLTDTWSTTVTVTPKPDLLPPDIEMTPLGTAEVRQPIPIVANITDESGVANATLLYRGVDGGLFLAIPMFIQEGGTNFTATIPAQPHAGTVEYVVVANDTWANEARAPLRGALTLQVLDPLGAFFVNLVIPAALGLAAATLVFLLYRRRRRVAPAAPTQAPPRPPP